MNVDDIVKPFASTSAHNHVHTELNQMRYLMLHERYLVQNGLSNNVRTMPQYCVHW